MIVLKLIRYPTRCGVAERWMAIDYERRFCGYGKTKAGARASMIGDVERRRRFGHLHAPGYVA